MQVVAGIDGNEYEVACFIDDRVANVAGLRNAGDAAMVELVAEVIANDLWEGSGINSPTHWVGWKFGLTRGRARQVVTIASRLDALPYLAKIFADGRLSFEQAHCVARYCPDGYDESVADFATYATMHQLRHTLSRYSFDAESRDDEQDGKPSRNRVSKGFGDDKRYRLSLDVDAASGATIDAAIDQAWARFRSDHEAAGLPVAEINLADVVTECFAQSARGDRSESRRAANSVMVHIDVDRLLELGTDKILGRLHLGPVLDPALSELLTCDANAQLVIRKYGRPINIGRSSAVIPRWLRRIVQHRDGGCRFCGSTINLDVHHIIHWARGGLTDEINLVTLCSRHHHAVHADELRILGDPTLDDPNAVSGPNRLRFVNRHGVEIGPAQRPRPPNQLPGHRYAPATGERLQPWAVWFSPN